jgi:hypothetical protein
MSSTDSPGATPHSEGHLWAEEDVEASRQILRRRLAKKQDRLEERAETVSAQRLRIRELEEEVERLREALKMESTLEGMRPSVVTDWPPIYTWANDLASQVRRYLGGQEVTRAQIKRSCNGVDHAVSAWKDALDAAEDGQDE